ncbi:hypothetical protein EC991_008008 [Linnemannia zychae]|nr:hypothetical protein EC991_008008 [Linnemannia zychae]
MKTTTALLLTLALALFAQAAPIETRDDKGPGSIPVDIFEVKELNRRGDIGWPSAPDDATVQDDKGPTSTHYRRGDISWSSNPKKPHDIGWSKRGDTIWNDKPAKPQDIGWD